MLGWRTQSLWDCRTTGLSVVPYGNGLAGNIRKAVAEILAALDKNVRAPITPWGGFGEIQEAQRCGGAAAGYCWGALQIAPSGAHRTGERCFSYGSARQGLESRRQAAAGRLKPELQTEFSNTLQDIRRLGEAPAMSPPSRRRSAPTHPSVGGRQNVRQPPPGKVGPRSYSGIHPSRL